MRTDTQTSAPTRSHLTGEPMDALNDLPPALIGVTSAAGMFAGLFWMIARGSLVTRREHEARVGDLKEQNATLKTTVEVRDEQLKSLAVVGETVIKILASVDDLARKNSR